MFRTTKEKESLSLRAGLIKFFLIFIDFPISLGAWGFCFLWGFFNCKLCWFFLNIEVIDVHCRALIWKPFLVNKKGFICNLLHSDDDNLHFGVLPFSMQIVFCFIYKIRICYLLFFCNLVVFILLLTNFISIFTLLSILSYYF